MGIVRQQLDMKAVTFVTYDWVNFQLYVQLILLAHIGIPKYLVAVDVNSDGLTNSSVFVCACTCGCYSCDSYLLSLKNLHIHTCTCMFRYIIYE